MVVQDTAASGWKHCILETPWCMRVAFVTVRALYADLPWCMCHAATEQRVEALYIPTIWLGTVFLKQSCLQHERHL